MSRVVQLVQAVRLKAGSQGSALSRKAVWLAGMMGLVGVAMLALPTLASAATCGNSWKGGAEGNWETPADWSLGTVPTSSEVVCVGSGKTVVITGGSQTAGVLVDEGTLSMSGGSLELADAGEASSAANLTVEGASIIGAGELTVSSSFTGGNRGAFKGTETVVLQSGVTGTVSGCGGPCFFLEGTTLKNAGTFTVAEGSGFQGERKAHIVNSGTFILNAQNASENQGLIAGGSEVSLLSNTGTVEKTEGSGTAPIGFEIDNEGKVSDTSGKMEFTNGGVSGEHSAGSWSTSGAGTAIVFNSNPTTFSLGVSVPMSGTIELEDGTVTAGTIEGAGAKLVLTGGSGSAHGLLEVSGKTPSTLEDLTLKSAGGAAGVLHNTSQINISHSFSAGGGAIIEGTGTVLVESGATGTIEPGSATCLTLEEGTLNNAGTLTVGEKSGISGRHGPKLVNSGTLIVNGLEPGSNHGLIASAGEATLTNTGVLEKTEDSGTTQIGFEIDNEGKVSDTSGKMEFVNGGVSGELAVGSWSTSGAETEILFGQGTFDLGASVPLNGTFRDAEGTLVAGVVEGAAATLTITKASGGSAQGIVEVNGAKPSTIENLTLTGVSGTFLGGGILTGSGEVNVTGSFTAGHYESLTGTGSLVLEPGVAGIMEGEGSHLNIEQHTLVIKGSFTAPESSGIQGEDHALILNTGTFVLNGEPESENHGLIAGKKEEEAKLINTGTLEKTEGTGLTPIEPEFENLGTIIEEKGHFKIFDPVKNGSSIQYGGKNESALGPEPSKCGDPVDCATGNYYETQTDLAVGGRGVGLDLTRTYNSQAAASGATGAFGAGWSSSFSDHLTVGQGKATLTQANGSTVPFAEGKGEAFTPPAWSQDTLSGNTKAGYSLVLPNQVKYQFEGATGRLQSVADRNGNQTKLGYGKTGLLETITDPAGRKITLAYNGEGLIENAKDPMGHTAKYTYSEGNLASVTLPGETKARWQYHYGEAHQMTLMIDGRKGETTNEYNAAHQLTSQTDPAGHKLKFEYEPFHTKITNNTTGAVTDEHFTSNNEPYAITRGFGTASASTETFTYDAENDLTSVTDGNDHTTTYTYENGNMTSMIDPDKDETKWTYDGTHDVLTVTTPDSEKTTITRNSNGDAETVSRPAPHNATQTTTYHYDEHGDLTSVVDPLKHTWSYEYDTEGDRTSEIDPEGGKLTFGYNEDSQETSTVSPAGNVKGAEAAKYTTKVERDQQGRQLKITDPLGHTTKYTYDGDGNIETIADPNGDTTTYTYNADNEPTKVKEPNGGTTETSYDGEDHLATQTDGNKHTTTYTRNALGAVIEIKDPLGRVTKKEYDAAGNLTSLTDAAKRTTKYAYDPANHLKEVSYSESKTPTVKYEYNGDGLRTKMIDGTGTTTYTYDILDRLVKTTNGHGNTTAYEYDLGSNQIKLTYPNNNLITRAYDSDGRLQSVTDWSGNTTSFAYDPNSNLTTTTFPKGTGEQDKSSYNAANQEMTITMTGSGLKVLASIAYTRDNDGQIKSTTTTGLPGTASISDAYDANNRLEKAGSTSYAYDSAEEPTTLGSNTSVYDAAGELKTSGSTTYGYDQLGERVSATPKEGQTTTYSYDQAGNLIQVKQGKAGGLNDTYAYNGDGLRASQTKGKTTSYTTWDAHASIPLILSDEQNSYIYGPNNVPIEQIQSKGTVLYLHHDQQDSTVMLTSSTGTVEATMAYDPYGNTTASTGAATTPLGYDGQYTSTDTGLIYLRARNYDPATAQFTTVDPIAGISLARYNYVNDNPLNLNDPTGLFLGIPGTPTDSEVAGTAGEVAEGAANTTVSAFKTATKAVSGVAAYAAPAIDVVAGGVCIAAAEICGGVLIGNFVIQQALALDQAVYVPNYPLGLNEAAIFTGIGLGALGASAVELSDISSLEWRGALGGAVTLPLFLLDGAQISAAEAQAFDFIC